MGGGDRDDDLNHVVKYKLKKSMGMASAHHVSKLFGGDMSDLLKSEKDDMIGRTKRMHGP